MLAAWLYRLKFQKVICLISCILLESPPISASFARQIIPSLKLTAGPPEKLMVGRTRQNPFLLVWALGPPFFSVSVSGGKKSLLDPIPTTANGASTLAKSSAGSAGPPVKVSPVMGSSASQKTSWMDDTPWEKDGSVREVHPPPPEVEQLAPLQNDGLKTFLFFWEGLFSGAMLDFGGVHENLPFLFILVQRKLDHHLSFVVDDCGKKDSELFSLQRLLAWHRKNIGIKT